MESRSGRLPGLLVATLAMVFVLVIWGGVVRLSGSGLAIPDWPLAEGKLIPRPHPNVLIEFGHRVIAMLVGFMTLAIAIVVFRSREYRRSLGMLTVAALITLALQVFMGGRVVLEELPVDRVVAHLLLAFTFFAILLLMALRAMEEPAPATAPAADPRTRSLGRFAHLAAGAVFLQAGLGAWVSSSGAALACPDFPTCQGSWLPPMTGLVGIHYAHRLGAYAIVVIVLGLLLAAAPARLSPRARWPLRFSGILLAVQILLGIANVVLRVPLPVSVAHLGTALALFGTLLTAAYELKRA
ncbi:MAG TPA: COX15/CtaA family protein [Candidatus Eisenbacteria bacterium]|nr:COX15/CtaA family protein [Candidatus Eisenbacteria bacterium]